MLSKSRFCLSLLPILSLCCVLHGQTPPPVKVGAPKLPPMPPRSQVAATVNGRAIPELAVYRALSRIPPDKWGQARPEVLTFLIENTLVDQYLEQLKIPVERKQVEQRVQQIKDEIKREGQDFNSFLQKLYLTEAELAEQIEGAIRWDAFVEKYGGEKALRNLFNKNKAMFDGSLVRAKHLLIRPAKKTPADAKVAKGKIESLQMQIESAIAQKLAALPANLDNLAKEKERQKAVEEVFSTFAKKHSDCPSKAQGGELGYFPRLGKMVEPFARTAFSVKPYDISDPVETEFGYHLILVTERKPGKDVKYEQVKQFVQEVHAERLREAILIRMRPISKVEVNQPKK